MHYMDIVKQKIFKKIESNFEKKKNLNFEMNWWDCLLSDNKQSQQN